MPYPNEHAARIRDPNDFEKDSFRRKTISDGIDIIIGKLKGGDGSMTTQAYRFDADKFTAEQAKAWLKKHDIKFISFEPASRKKENVMAIERKIFKSEIKSFDDKNLILEHFISTASVDDGGDIMEPEGMIARGKVVVLFQHGKDIAKGVEPIARPLSFAVGVNKGGTKGIIAKTQYYNGEHLTPPDNTGRRLYEKAKGGFMPNWSIGWEPLESEPKADGTRHVKKWRLFEYSQVAVGMNEEASNDIDVKLYPIVEYKECENCGSCGKCGEKPITFKEIPESAAEQKTEKTDPPKENKDPEKPSSIKAISDQLAIDMPYRNLQMIHEAMLSELFKQSYNSDPSLISEDEIVTNLTAEYIGLASPHMKACATDIRRRKRENKSFDNIIMELKNFDAVPAPEKKDTSAKVNPPPAQEIVLKLADEPKVSIPCSEEELRNLLKEALGEHMKPAMTAELRKLTGKLD